MHIKKTLYRELVVFPFWRFYRTPNIISLVLFQLFNSRVGGSKYTPSAVYQIGPCRTAAPKVWRCLKADLFAMSRYTPNHFNVHNQRHYEIGSVSEILVEYQLRGLCSAWFG